VSKDLSDPRVVAQLETKHPLRKEAVPAEYMNLKATLRSLRRRRGTGTYGKRNEHLIVFAKALRGWHQGVARHAA